MERCSVGPATYPRQALRGLVSPHSRACGLPPTLPLRAPFPCSSSRTFFFFSDDGPRQRQQEAMSSSTSGSQKEPQKVWPHYGEVPLTRCPDCPRPDPLKRLTCVRSQTGNVGREFVKCESKPCKGNDGKVGFVSIWRDLEFEIFRFGN